MMCLALSSAACLIAFLPLWYSFQAFFGIVLRWILSPVDCHVLSSNQFQGLTYIMRQYAHAFDRPIAVQRLFHPLPTSMEDQLGLH